jgi:serine/threonine protein kinase
MGQVYRAADTRLDRAVAIKVIPASLAHDNVRGSTVQKVQPFIRFRTVEA